MSKAIEMLVVDDDPRKHFLGASAYARTCKEAIALIEEHGVKLLSLDFELARGETTQEVVDWLIERPRQVERVRLHSNRIDAVYDMRQQLEQSYSIEIIDLCEKPTLYLDFSPQTLKAGN